MKTRQEILNRIEDRNHCPSEVSDLIEDILDEIAKEVRGARFGICEKLE